MNDNGLMNNGLVKLNDCFQNGNNQVRNGVTGEGQWPSKKDESRINEDMENESDKQTVQVSSQVGQKRSLEQSREPLVQWKRFMPLQSLKVLLVEYDDSTRQVVSALLRNCGYEVTAVANGLQAWKILEDLTIHVDLVLTEIVMPHMSGISLLSKIMIHKTIKNIPVIMMSSHDSMSIVSKCLSEGAVDFLVKPIRKNELKNLWQHVWRKCQNSSSGSGCESGTQTQKSTRMKSAEKSGNNTGSNDKDCIGIRLNIVDGSDTQSSWTKRVVEADSSQISAVDQLTDIPDNTSSQVTLSRPEAFNVNWAPIIAAKEHGLQDFELDMGKDLEIGVPSFPTMRFKDPGEKGLAKKAVTNIELKNEKVNEQQEKRDLELNDEKANGEIQVVNIMGDVTTSSSEHHIESIAFSILNDTAKVADKKDTANHDEQEIPSLELSLKSQRDDRGIKTSACDKNVLRCSNLSAFSRYVSASTTDQTPIGNVGSCSPDDSSEAAKAEMQDFQSNINSASPKQVSNGSSNNNDMGSTTKNAFTKQVASGDKPVSNSLVKCHPNSFAFHLGLDGTVPLTQPTAQDNANAPTTKAMLTQAKDMNSVQVEHHHHHYHHHHHHVYKMPKHRLLQNQKEMSLENVDAAALQHGELSMLLDAPQEDNAYNQGLNGSASGSSKHGSNGQSESTATLNARETKVGSDDGITHNGGIIDGSGNGITHNGGIIDGSGNGSRAGAGVDQNFFTQREAALNKFRQKRKERCFEKKVRYRSRQKLAEQRPRVRGQFVRQVFHENKGKDTQLTRTISKKR